MFNEEEREAIVQAMHDIDYWIRSNVSTVIYKKLEVPFEGAKLVIPIDGPDCYISAGSLKIILSILNVQMIRSDEKLPVCADLIGSWQNIRPVLQKTAADSIRVRNIILNFHVKPIEDELR